MSASLRTKPVRSARRRAFFSRGWRAGLAVGLSSAVLFTLVGNRLIEHGYAVPEIVQLWSVAESFTQLGGQWSQQLFIALVRLVPGSSVHSLIVATIIGAAFVQGFLAHDLVKRGWPPGLVALAQGLIALHPVMLFIATNGSPMLLYAILASFAIFALDRLEAIGDTQSLIVMGLVLALLAISWPSALFFILPLLLLLPIAFRKAKTIAGAAAMYMIVAAPGLIVLSAVAIGGTLFEVPWSQVAASWMAPMHGASPDIVAQSGWLNDYGGRPLQALFQLLLLCAVIVPNTLVIVVRLAVDRAERTRPATALAALLVPPIAGALATGFWQINSPWVAIALSMLCSSAWAATARFRRWERWLWAWTILIGVIVSWSTPLLWVTPNLQSWHDIILTSFHVP
jgi:hypothetical protein